MTRKKLINLSLFIMVLLIMVQGCSAADYLTFHGDAQRTGYVADAGPLSENLRWSVSPGYIDSSPVVEGDRVYIATIADWNNPEAIPAVFCYDKATGAEVWTYETGSECGLTVAGDLLIVGGLDGYLTALNTADGSEAWSVLADEKPGFFGLSSSPLYYNGLIYMLTPSDGGLHVYDPADGSEEWSVAFGAWDVGWTNATYFTAPAATDGAVYFPSNLSEFYAYDTTTRAEIWNNTVMDGTIKSTPVIGTDSLFVTTTTTLYEVSLADGAILKSRAIDGQLGTPALNSTSNLLYVGTGTGLLCLNSEDIEAASVWKTNTAAIISSPVVAGNYVYAGTNEVQSSLYAYSATDGTEMWSYTLPAPAGGNYAAFWGSSPAVADGTLYIGAEYTNTLFAFGPGAAYETTVVLQEGEKVALTDDTLVNETTAAGAIHAASEACGFTIDTSDEGYSSLNLLGDMGYDAGTGYWWQQFDNGESSMIGLDQVARDGDTFSFWYSGWGNALPAETTGVPNLVTVHVSVLSEDIGAFSVADTSVARGGSFLARLDVVKADAGWYVIDVSGVDSEGNSLSGLATVELAASTIKTNIPVHVQVPLNAPTGEYELFAAVYAFNSFPYTKPVTSEGIACTVL